MAPTPVMFDELEESRPTFNSSRGYWLAAIEYLQNGEENDAEWALEQALALKPNSKISQTLLSQIAADPIDVLGEVYFEYTVQNGDSLSKLAKEYLNDPMQFYILAKYNDISNPSRLRIGKSIRIPGDKPVKNEVLVKVIDLPPMEITINESSNVDSNFTAFAEAGALFQKKDYEAVIDLLSESEETGVSETDMSKLLVKAYFLKSQELLETGNISEAKILLEKAAELEPDNVDVNMAIIDMDEPGQAHDLVEQSVKALAANDPVKAYEFINKALVIHPEYSLALKKQKEIKHQLAQYYYKQALMAQRRQELNQAVAYWDKVLILDVNNQNAKLYRAKSIALQNKMKKFVSAL